MNMLDWTTELPTQDGWYWVIVRGGKTPLLALIEENDGVFLVSHPGKLTEYELSEYDYFMGPLPEPESPRNFSVTEKVE